MRNNLFLALLLLLNLAMAVNAADPLPDKPKWLVPISKETTRVTGPLKEDGSVDYAAALDKILSAGVTPDNNALVPLIEIVGPLYVPEPLRETYLRRLGVKSIPDKPLLAPWSQHVTKLLLDNKLPADFDGDSVLDGAMSRPWSADELPELAAWLKLNDAALNRAVEATKRPRLWSPLVVEQNEPLFTIMLLPTRDVDRALAVRAMSSLQKGKTEQARVDIAALRKLGTLRSQEGFLLSLLLASSAHGSADQATWQVAEHINLTAAAAKQWIADIRATPLPKLADSLDTGERFCILDNTQCALRQALFPKLSEINKQLLPGISLSLQQVATGTVDWGVVFRRENESLDRVVEILRETDSVKQQAAWTALEQELRLASLKLKDGRAALDRVAKGPTIGAALGGILHDHLFGSYLPAVLMVRKSCMRAEVRRDLSMVALALSAYKTEHGSYPDELGKLTPAPLPEIPPDRFGIGKLVYRRTKEGFVLYSVGDDGTDDGGEADPDDPENERDIAVRVPSTKPTEPPQKPG